MRRCNHRFSPDYSPNSQVYPSYARSAHSSARNQDAMPVSAEKPISQPITRVNTVALETLSVHNQDAPVPFTHRTSLLVISRHIQNLLIHYWPRMRSSVVPHLLQAPPPISDIPGYDLAHCQDISRATRQTIRMIHQDHDGRCQFVQREETDLRKKLR